MRVLTQIKVWLAQYSIEVLVMVAIGIVGALFQLGVILLVRSLLASPDAVYEAWGWNIIVIDAVVMYLLVGLKGK